MGEKLTTLFVIIFAFIMPSYVTYLTFANIRMEEAYFAADGDFGKIEISDVDSSMDVDLDAINRNTTHTLMSFPKDRILEVHIYLTNDVIKDYVDYKNLENNTYYYGNITLYINGYLEAWGILSEGEFIYIFLEWFVLFIGGLFVGGVGADILDDTWRGYKHRREQKRKDEERRRKKAEAEARNNGSVS